MGFRTIRLAWVKGNPQAEHFWIKNGFESLKENVIEFNLGIIEDTFQER